MSDFIFEHYTNVERDNLDNLEIASLKKIVSLWKI